jgi:formylmethanofuran dehydrogenase subunit E
MADELKFIVAGCGHIVTPFNLGGKCESCGKLCCKECLIEVNDKKLCPTCFKKFLKGNQNG